MSDQLSMFLSALTDLNIITLGEAAEWLANRGCDQEAEVAKLIYPEEDQDSVLLAELFDLKDHQHEFNLFREMIADDDARLEVLITKHQ